MSPSARAPSLRFLYNHAAHSFLHRNPTVSLSLLDQLFDQLPASSQPWFIGPLLREREKDIEGLRRKAVVLWVSCLVCQFGDLYREHPTETSESMGKGISKTTDERARDKEGWALFGRIRKRCLEIYQPSSRFSPSASAAVQTKNGPAPLASSSSCETGSRLDPIMAVNTTIDIPFVLPPSIIHPLLLSAQTLFLDTSILSQTLIEPFLKTIPLALTNTLAALSRSRASAEGMRAKSLGEEGWIGDVLEGYQDVMSAWARCLGGESGKTVIREDRILGKEFKEQIIESLNPPSPLPSPMLSRLPSFNRASSIDRASSPTPSDSSASSITSAQTTTPTSYRLQRQNIADRGEGSDNRTGKEKAKGKGKARSGMAKRHWNGLDSGVEGLSGDESYEEEEQDPMKDHSSTASTSLFPSISSSPSKHNKDQSVHKEIQQDESQTSYTSTLFGSKLVLLQKFLQPRPALSSLSSSETPSTPLLKQPSTDLSNPNGFLSIFLRAIKSSFRAGLFLWIIWHVIRRLRAGWFKSSILLPATSAGGGVVSGAEKAEEVRRRLRRGILARF